MKAALHVVYVCADRGVPIGGRKGASAHVWELTRALTQRGVEVRILAARRAESMDDHGLPAPVIDLGADRACRAMRQTVFSNAVTSRQQAVAAETYGLLLNHPLGRELERLHRRWRIDVEWWKKDGGVARDHLTLRTADGTLCEVYGDRRTGGWYLQRMLD